jgi:hypothetical protein
MDQKMSSGTVDPPTSSQRIPASTPKTRNRVVLDRGDGRQWTPPPTARELTAADPSAGHGSQTWSRSGRENSGPVNGTGQRRNRRRR